ncbi:hypothetical protein PBY51_010828 [Eleginops maclovinus]|uniref:Uncharacterized protein n=1 Tax=Eleginops maclovinus TaxID=56733 RepID=A0AAN8AJW5_ELEMC|nr:hypothetical protein PBY51_010828 [Eleginops maclovinus]
MNEFPWKALPREGRSYSQSSTWHSFSLGSFHQTPKPSFNPPSIPHLKNPGKHKHPSLPVTLDKELCRLAGLRGMRCLSPRGAEGKHGDLTIEEWNGARDPSAPTSTCISSPHMARWLL